MFLTKNLLTAGRVLGLSNILPINRVGINRLIATQKIAEPTGNLIKVHDVDESSAFRLKSFIEKHLHAYNPYEDAERLSKTMRDEMLTHFSLPDFSKEMVETGNPAVSLIRGLPIDESLPNTPTSEETPKEKTFLSEFVMIMLANAFHSHIYVNGGEKNNSYFQNVMHVPGNETKKVGVNAKLKLGWHVENIHEISPPDLITLLALRGDKNARTEFIFLDEIIDKLPELVIQELSQNKFIMKTGPSYNQYFEHIAPILQYDRELGWLIRYNANRERCEPKDIFAQIAMNQLDSLIKKATPHSVCLEAGDAAVLNNRKILHDRSVYKATTLPGEGRWLQRMYQKSFRSASLHDSLIYPVQSKNSFSHRKFYFSTYTGHRTAKKLAQPLQTNSNKLVSSSEKLSESNFSFFSNKGVSEKMKAKEVSALKSPLAFFVRCANKGAPASIASFSPKVASK